MANQDKLDATDIKMLKILQQNSRLTVKELAAKSESLPHPGFRTTEAVRAGRVYPALRCYRRPPQTWK